MSSMLKFLSRRPPTPTAELRPFDLTDLGRRARQDNEASIRALCMNAYVGGNTSLCRVLGRYKMFVDTKDVSVSAHLMVDGYWEMWLTEAMAARVRPGMTAIDVGANLGYFTILMADLVGAGGHIHAFEPNSDLRWRLRKSLLVNGFLGRATLYADPLWSEDGVNVVLSSDTEQSGGGYIHGGDHPPQAREERLVTRRLDGFAELADADIIKIDAEAAEQAIWIGAEGLLARRRTMTIFLEFTACRYADPGGFVDAILAHGFRLAYLTVDDGLQVATRQDILALPALEDQMLVLTRN